MSAASGHRSRPEPDPERPEPQRAAAPSGSTGLGHLDIEQRLALLKKQFREQTAPDAAAEAEAAPKPATKPASHVLLRRGIKTLVAIAVVAAVVWLPTQRLFQTTSVEAVVNARTLTLRAPIEGVVSFDSATPAAVGASFNAGAPLLHVTNSRADRARLDDLRRMAERAETDVAVLKDRLDNATRMQAQYSEQTQLFRQGRIAQLEARLQESQNNLSSATTRQEETAAILERATSLDAQGFSPRRNSTRRGATTPSPGSMRCRSSSASRAFRSNSMRRVTAPSSAIATTIVRPPRSAPTTCGCRCPN